MTPKLLLYWEQHYPPIIGACVGVALALMVDSISVPARIFDLVSTSVNISGIAIGFLATTQALVYSQQENYIVKQLRKLGMFDLFLDYFSSAIHWCLVLLILGAVSFFFPLSDEMEGGRWFFIGWLTACTIAAIACYRVIRISGKFLRSTSNAPS